MRAGLRIAFAALMVVGAGGAALAGAFDNAAAPPGSYLQSCLNVKYVNGMLYAACTRDNNPVDFNASLNVAACRPGADIYNEDGGLYCVARKQTYGVGGAAPDGSFRRSCKFAHVAGTTLHAFCTSGDGSVDMTLNLTHCDLGKDIYNSYAGLECTPGKGAATPPPPPPPKPH